MTVTTITFDAGSDTNIDAFGAGPDWAYMAGSGSAAQVDAANDRVQFTGFTGNEVRVRYIGAATVTGDQDITATVNVKNFNNGGCLARCSASADTCYQAIIEPAQTNEIRLYRVVTGTATLIASWDDGLAAGTHTIRLRAVNNGSQVDLTVQSNSNTAHTFADTDAARITSGNPGFFGSTDENFTWLDTWILDDLASGATGQPTVKRFGGVPHMAGRKRFGGGSGGGAWGMRKSGLIVPHEFKEAA